MVARIVRIPTRNLCLVVRGLCALHSVVMHNCMCVYFCATVCRMCQVLRREVHLPAFDCKQSKHYNVGVYAESQTHPHG
jgi:hypothetical protein